MAFKKKLVSIKYGVTRPSGWVHCICVLMAESSQCGFEPRPRYLHVCPWARHFTVIASLHPGVKGYLWGQSWLLCLISPTCTCMCAEMAAIELYTRTPPGSWDGFRNDLCARWAGGNNVKRCDTSCKSAIKNAFIIIIIKYGCINL